MNGERPIGEPLLDRGQPAGRRPALLTQLRGLGAYRALELEAQLEHLVSPAVVDKGLLSLGEGVLEHHEHRLVANGRAGLGRPAPGVVAHHPDDGVRDRRHNAGNSRRRTEAVRVGLLSPIVRLSSAREEREAPHCGVSIAPVWALTSRGSMRSHRATKLSTIRSERLRACSIGLRREPLQGGVRWCPR